MTSVVLNSRVGPDGMLHLTVPVGAANANQDVFVTVNWQVKAPYDEKAWHAFLESIEGKWQGEFERPPQGEYEKREEFQ